jgi:hypothetical protein
MKEMEFEMKLQSDLSRRMALRHMSGIALGAATTFVFSVPALADKDKGVTTTTPTKTETEKQKTEKPETEMPETEGKDTADTPDQTADAADDTPPPVIAPAAPPAATPVVKKKHRNLIEEILKKLTQ